jgi:UDP-N-acetylmuramoyl-tripeptide--D-alanyl-D-alanine ligase
MDLSLRKIATHLGCEISGPDDVVRGWSFDTRTLEPGDAFIALQGQRDGHEYVTEAFAKGAVAAIVSRDVPGRTIRVADTQKALESVAAIARQWWGGILVAVTGSAGKTTTKDAISRVLETRFQTASSAGNLNNEIGVPISILRLPGFARFAVIEMGMNHAGEIRKLAEIARPDVAVVTNVGTAHIEAFHSIEGIALAKRELVEALSPKGVAVLNWDDKRVRHFADVHSGRSITFGLEDGAEIRASMLSFEADGSTFAVDGVDFKTQFRGRHGVMNILAALAVAQNAGIPLRDLKEAVETLTPSPMRGQIIQVRENMVINDCYNSNPEAAMAMLDVLKGLRSQRHIAVLGEMRELGPWQAELHRQVGQYAATIGVEVVIGIGGEARHLVEAAAAAGAGSVAFFDEPREAGAHVKSMAVPGDAILFKGSRGTRVELALQSFSQSS